MVREIAFCAAVMMAVAGAAGAQVALVRGGEPLATVVAVGDAGKEAAAELALSVERMSGAKLAVVAPAQAPASGAVFVGAAGDFASLPFQVALGPHAFTRRTAGGNLYLVGGDAKGAAFAVCDLLEDFGCRWFMPGEIGEVIPRLDTLVVEECELVEAPAFESRQMWYAWGATSPEAGGRQADWQRRNKVAHLPFGHGHNFAGTVRPELYFEEHPEYYALVDGKRSINQLCTTNPDVIRIAAEVASAYFDQHPEYISYSLCPDDNSDFCECANCRALDREMDPNMPGKPNVTDRLMVFWNAVAERVWERHPGKQVAIYAYINHTLPPKDGKVHAGVMPVVTTSVFCPIHSAADRDCPERSEMRRILEGWTGMATRVYIYEYDPTPGYAELPCPLFGAHARSMKLYRDLGIRGFSFETHQSWATTFPNFYVLARLMWNPDENPEAILDDLCNRFFGAAAKPMRRYYRALESAFSGSTVHTGWGHRDLLAIWTPDIMRECRAALDAALAAADDAVVRRRLDMVDLGLQYLENFRTMMMGHTGDYDAGMAAAERCTQLINQMFETNEDYIVEHDAHKQVDGQKADLGRYFMRSAAFRGQNDIIHELPVLWRFRLDPDNSGLRRGWAGRWFVDWEWPKIRTDEMWFRQLGERVTGYGWVRTRVVVPQQYRGRRIVLWIGALDEQGWIYVNGQLAHRRREDTYDAWRQPFECDITRFVEFGQENTIAVRALAETTLGGLWRKALLYSPK